MKYLSLCSGIEAASVAWHHMGWEPVAFSEIESFPSAVLANHYPNTPNWGDMTKYQEWPDANVNVLVGGTPCQSFSVAGLRKGLEDPRGNLMLTYLAIADRYRPKWLVWENVPGVLSSNSGRDFGAFLGGLGQLGYGFAYRVLDAQYFGVAQRRRRVFVVGCLGGWQRAAAVLFERHSLSGHPAPSRETGKAVAGTIAARFGNSRNNHEELALHESGLQHTVGTLCSDTHPGSYSGQDAYTGRLVPITFGARMSVPQTDVDMVQTLQATNPMAVAQPVPFDTTQLTSPANYSNPQPGDPCHPLAAGARPPAIAWDEELNASVEQAGTLLRGGAGGRHDGVMQTMQVRRLTPVECERLQGFPDHYTLIPIAKRQPIKGQPAVVKMAPDGPRYKALGNSMAVPVMRWIGERINQVEGIP